MKRILLTVAALFLLLLVVAGVWFWRSLGKPLWRRLVYAADTKIRRCVKIRQTANPFDPQWKAYFKERAFFKKFGISRQQAGIKPS